MTEPTFVIVGASLAGAKAAETLREEGFTGRIVLLGDDHHRPYERPPLSKDLLLGKAEAGVPYVHEAGWYAEHDVDLRVGTRVIHVDRERKTVRTAAGEEIGYHRLLLATGSRPRDLPVPGAELGNVLTLRTLDDSDRLAEILTDGARLTIVGSGWIGLEIAAAARGRGVAVTVVTPESAPLQHVLGDELAAVFGSLHRTHGVDFRYRTHVAELRGDGDVAQVVLDDGTVLDTDYVLIAVGAAPNVELAEQAGLAVDGGVLVDAHHRTSDADIFAAGDIANIDHPLLGHRVRVEHWANALQSGPAAARAMLDRGTPWDHLPYFFTDQYELGMEYAGWVPPGGQSELVVRGSLDALEAVVFWTVEGRVAAGMNINVWEVTDQIQDLVRAGLAGQRIDLARLADAAVELPELLK
ncbi:NAD(P)/FAD-dependent oxidoreductase [Actinoplanes palleronii]|uniref:Ferredoxin n=1 Tax=Actinoplanes palleronii TaxID=113570 RepID=A0ABQ4BP73_9ACTN|nr:FAD-dependent oxidoreductase [Actinoplanes palleronii]GIE72086.1 ferredoxin [Actinoplanes palleronii]